ncbi:hypothetical protein KQX54_000371, partial [Cotesia glomerata]
TLEIIKRRQTWIRERIHDQKDSKPLSLTVRRELFSKLIFQSITPPGIQPNNGE